ncbi:13505_t:CDS:2, partial [Racocetra fulgida]
KKLSELEKKHDLLLDKLKSIGVHDVSEDADRQKIVQLELNNKKNKFISYRLLTTGQEKKADPIQNKISYSSPLGKVLMNKKIGEVGNFSALESEKTIIILAAGQDYALSGSEEQQLGCSYLKENRDKIQGIIVNNTTFHNTGFLAQICQELGQQIPIYTSVHNKLVLHYLYPQIKNRIVVMMSASPPILIGDFTCSFFPLPSYLLGNCVVAFHHSQYSFYLLEEVLLNNLRILNERFLLLVRQILAKSSLGQVISREGEIILLVVNHNNIETEIDYHLQGFPVEQKSNFHFLLGLPPVIGKEESLAELVDYLHAQSEEVTNLSKKEYFNFRTSFYKNAKFLPYLSGPFLTLPNHHAYQFFDQKITPLKVKKTLTTLEEILIKQRKNLQEGEEKLTFGLNREDSTKVIKETVKRRCNELVK